MPLGACFSRDSKFSAVNVSKYDFVRGEEDVPASCDCAARCSAQGNPAALHCRNPISGLKRLHGPCAGHGRGAAGEAACLVSRSSTFYLAHEEEGKGAVSIPRRETGCSSHHSDCKIAGVRVAVSDGAAFIVMCYITLLNAKACIV
jgi:hypothetical protein